MLGRAAPPAFSYGRMCSRFCGSTTKTGTRNITYRKEIDLGWRKRRPLFLQPLGMSFSEAAATYGLRPKAFWVASLALPMVNRRL
jgi:hypothetical protein